METLEKILSITMITLILILIIGLILSRVGTPDNNYNMIDYDRLLNKN